MTDGCISRFLIALFIAMTYVCLHINNLMFKHMGYAKMLQQAHITFDT